MTGRKASDGNHTDSDENFNVVLSWSGSRSREVARAFREWLPKVVQTARPWMSETDIEKGAVWSKEIAQRLGSCRAGVSFVTHDNRSAPWLVFEAGAMLK